MATKTKLGIKDVPARATPLGLRGPVKEAFLITSNGLDELVGSDALELEQKIHNDKEHSPLDYRHFDDDKHIWAYWAIEHPDESISPYNLPDLQQYSTTAPQLYTKAVVFPQIVARIVRKLKEVPPSLWDKMMKPATILLAIVGIILVIAIFMVAAQG
jgi:hypothetical protein